MTDFIDNLLTSMSSKFNETNADLQINLNEDKTLKWRGLHNNQYAAVKKRKDIKRSEKAAQPNTSSSTTSDDPPLMCDSVSVTVNADDVATADVTKPHENDSMFEMSTVSSEKSDTNSSVGNDTKSVSADKMEKINNDKEKDDDQRPFRRTLRRKQIADEINEDVSANDRNRKIGLRPKRQSSAGSASENRSVSPRGDKDDKSTSETAANRNIMTRQRGRARKNDRESSAESSVQSKSTADETNETLPKTRSERKNSISNEVDDGQNTQPPPLKLRRSERTHTSTPSDQKEHIILNPSDDRAKTETDAVETKPIDKEHVTRSRKRTLDDKKPQECIEIKDEKSIDDKSMPTEMEVVEVKDDVEPKTEATPEAKTEITQKSDDIEIIESTPDTTNDDQLSNGSDGTAVVRKRGRKPGITKAKGNLKLSMTIATRNSPAKKSPRFTNDETPFVYTIPKKDKIAAEQVSHLLIDCCFLDNNRLTHTSMFTSKQYFELLMYFFLLLGSTSATFITSYKTHAKNSCQ